MMFKKLISFLLILICLTASSLAEQPSSQRGAFIVRGTGSPFSQEPGVLFAFTAAYVRDGALATWKDVSTVTIPLDINLPETARLIRVQPASGDDSIQNPEQHIEMEYTYADGILSFTTKTPALYMLIEST